MNKKYSVFILFLIFALSLVPGLVRYSGEIAYVTAANEDEYDNYMSLQRILSPSDFYFADYLKLFVVDFTSWVWWALMALVALPFKLIGSEQGMIISVRAVFLLLPTLGTFFLIYKILCDFADGRLRMFIVYAAMAFCFYTYVNVFAAVTTLTEPAYGFLLTLSFYLLYRDEGRYGRRYYYSVVLYAAASSIKMFGLIFGAVFLMYFIWRRRGLNVKVLAKSALLWCLTVFSMNIPLVHPEVRELYGTLFQYAALWGKHGFIHYDWYREWPSPASFFVSDYFNPYAFSLIVIGFVSVSAYEYFKSRSVNPVYLMSFGVVSIYFIFAMFYMRTPYHYALVGVYFLPVIIYAFVSFFSRLPSGRAAVFVLAPICLIFSLQGGNLRQVYGFLFEGKVRYAISRYDSGTYHIEKINAIDRLRGFLESYEGKTDLMAVTRALSIPNFKGKTPNYYHLTFLPAGIAKTDLIILWKKDWAYIENFARTNKYEEGMEGPLHTTHRIYLNIKNGDVFLIDGRPVAFEKVMEDGEFEIYRKRQP